MVPQRDDSPAMKQYLRSPLLLWPLYAVALALLLRGAIFLAVGVYALSIVLAIHALSQNGSRRRGYWLVALLPFWVLAYPACVLTHGARPGTLGIANLHALLGIIIAVFSAVGVVWAMPMQDGRPPKDIANMVLAMETDSPAARKNAVMEILNAHPFEPAWWLRNQHAQTLWNPFFRRQNPIDYVPERVGTPDGDFLYLHFYPGDAEKPILLLLHGLEGSVNSPYITGINHTMHEVGWNTVTMEFRFCSGAINNTKRIYHMGETTDVDYVARLLAERYPGKPIYVFGVSLGANVIGKWLGEQGDAVPESIKGAALVSPPFNPSLSAPNFHKIFFGLYVKNFLRTLIPKALAKEKQFPGCMDAEKVKNCDDFYSYDTEVTARLHGFRDAADYWEKVGCHQFLDKIRVPTLLLTSADDPFNPPETIPRETADASPWLLPQWTSHGGHVGFIAGNAPIFAHCWLENQVARFFCAYEKLNGEA